jgi:carbon starvation protein
MAIVAASVIDPGVYFAMNSPPAIVGSDAATVAQTVSSWGFVVTPEVLTATATDIGEHSILSRAGGAPTLAVGIAQILHSVLPGANTMAFWYHFAILFEAPVHPDRGGRRHARRPVHAAGPARNLRACVMPHRVVARQRDCHRGCVAMWGYFLYPESPTPGRHQHAVAALRHRKPDARCNPR